MNYGKSVPVLCPRIISSLDVFMKRIYGRSYVKLRGTYVRSIVITWDSHGKSVHYILGRRLIFDLLPTQWFSWKSPQLSVCVFVCSYLPDSRLTTAQESTKTSWDETGRFPSNYAFFMIVLLIWDLLPIESPLLSLYRSYPTHLILLTESKNRKDWYLNKKCKAVTLAKLETKLTGTGSNFWS